MVLTVEQTAGLGWNRDMITLWEQYVERLQEMKVDHVEFCLLNALVLFYPGNPFGIHVSTFGENRLNDNSVAITRASLIKITLLHNNYVAYM